MSITLDNASSNDAAMTLFKDRLRRQMVLHPDTELLHTRCAAHIMNLVVGACMKAIAPEIEKMRSFVRALGAPKRRQAWVDTCKDEDLSVVIPPMDCQTRWNYTYLMLEACIRYKSVFRLVSRHDNVLQSNHPTAEQWKKSEEIADLLKPFFDSALAFESWFFDITD